MGFFLSFSTGERKEDLSFYFSLSSLLFVINRVCVFEEEKEAGEGMWAGAFVIQKASSEIAISLGGACEEKKIHEK